ncbi:MAG: threonine--tRNA ligase [Acidobacteria bacterium RIFCSPLOWO2_12_FULL_67_14]|nr:MAG: threonine--tRNA ligase [Acidobacteria bacterium RIFCSPLOWO2_02_FULL_67_21]OFW37283.1 MAG: threonine--tRNA ligase [Acidobacteria bacterium RIFCSPLOWO2_12_FULL_67_14]
MNDVTITLPDGATRTVPAGTTVREIAAAISPRLAKAALAGTVDGRLVDLSCPTERDAAVRVITPESPEALTIYRHSTAHLLAAAVTHLFPDVQCGIGPPTDDGFFYDFVVPRPFVPEDLEAIERKMRELAQQDLPYERQLWPREEARRFFGARGEPLKVQLIDEKTEGQADVSCYTIKDPETFVDFCLGPHVPSTGRLKAFKLLSTSNAYWKGDARNQPMQRIYGTAFFADKDLQAYLHRLEEAKRRDHRKIGREQKLFMFHPWAPGATFWLAKGTVLYNVLADYMREVLLPAGYVEVKAPIVFNKALWETSGHWQHYRQNMFLVESEGEQMGLKAMNCPGHFLMYASEVRSYRDLPLRFHEQTPLHRNEASGVLSGLTRVRQFSQDDAHCFVMESQIGEEVERLLRLVQRVYGDFGLTPEMKLSTRPAEYLGTVEQWNHAEAELKTALKAAGAPYTINEGDGAFYGPKIDFDVTDAIGRKWQCATIQLDYMQAERFDLKYIGADNAEHRPVVIHRAIFGSFERFVALLIEHFAGAWPLWLAPVQAVVLPIADRHLAYARSVSERLSAAGLRVEVDERQEKIGYKIREAQLQKVPYMLVAGDRELADGTVAVRSRSAGDLGPRSVADFVRAALDEIGSKDPGGQAAQMETAGAAEA